MSKYDKYKDVDNDNIYNRILQCIGYKLKLKTLRNIIIKKQKIEKLRRSMRSVKFVFHVLPQGASRPKYTFKTGHFYVPENSLNKNYFKKFLKQNKHLYNDIDMIYTNCHMVSRFYLPIPATMGDDEKILAEFGYIEPLSKPDWDNLGKTTDIFNDILWVDDSIVTKASVEKYYSFKPRIEFEIYYFKGFDSKYNKTRMLNRKIFKNFKKKRYHEMEE